MSGKRVAVVGNGPSAGKYGREIDDADFVVRCSWFTVVGAEGAGEKLDAWAWLGHHLFMDEMKSPPSGEYECWATLPLSRCNPPHKEHCGNVLNVLAWAGRRVVRQTTEEDWAAQAAAIQSAPSTGFTAVDMAISSVPNITKLVLYGFDATVPDSPGWNDARPYCQWPPECPHDFAAEKRELAKMAHGYWLGEPIDFKLVWRR